MSQVCRELGCSYEGAGLWNGFDVAKHLAQSQTAPADAHITTLHRGLHHPDPQSGDQKNKIDHYGMSAPAQDEPGEA